MKARTLMAMAIALLCSSAQLEAQMVRIKIKVAEGQPVQHVQHVQPPVQPPVLHLQKSKSVQKITPRKHVQKTKKVWRDENIRARWTWPGYPSTAALRKHIKGEPHYKNADNLSNRELVELHNREHDKLGPMRAPARSAPARKPMQRSRRGLWGSPRFCPTGSS